MCFGGVADGKSDWRVWAEQFMHTSKCQFNVALGSSWLCLDASRGDLTRKNQKIIIKTLGFGGSFKLRGQLPNVPMPVFSPDVKSNKTRLQMVHIAKSPTGAAEVGSMKPASQEKRGDPSESLLVWFMAGQLVC